MSYINLPFIAAEAVAREKEHMAFRSFLKGKDGKEVDKLVIPLGEKYTQAIDCTQCGNCCKKYMISIDKNDIEKLARGLHITVDACKEKYVEGSDESDTYLMNAIPCKLLKDNKCTVYEHRPETCAEFPHVDKPGFTSRLFQMIDAYGVCPIVYHVMEDLKKEYRFRF
jgi:uncharacterized protein